VKSLRDVLTLDRPLLGLDLETTGTGKDARIVEIGLEIMIPDKPTKEYRTLINPGLNIPPGATAVHSITDDMVRGAPHFIQLADNLIKGFAGADFAGYNVRFDLRVLASEFKRVGRGWDYDDARVIDGFRLWQIAEGRSLTDAIDRWLGGDTRNNAPTNGVDEPTRNKEAHSALWDVKMATRVIAAQLESCATLPRDVQKLHDLCSPGWFDSEGKLQWKGTYLCIGFGQHRDNALHKVPKSYLEWILKSDFGNKVKEACRATLRGEVLRQHSGMSEQMDPDDE
jgi:DNA polymerase-3 subunit epsilon